MRLPIRRSNTFLESVFGGCSANLFVSLRGSLWQTRTEQYNQQQRQSSIHKKRVKVHANAFVQPSVARMAAVVSANSSLPVYRFGYFCAKSGTQVICAHHLYKRVLREVLLLSSSGSQPLPTRALWQYLLFQYEVKPPRRETMRSATSSHLSVGSYAKKE